MPPPTSVASRKPLNAVEREWLSAREAFERRDVSTLAAARERFNTRAEFATFPLTPYVTWWWISAQLAQSAQNVRVLGTEIERFSSAHPEAPFADQLRRDHLRALGKLDLWVEFAANEAKYLGDDGEVACQRLRYRLIGQTNATATVLGSGVADAKALFAAAKPAAEPCYEVFELLASTKAVKDDDTWRRARALFDAGQLADARRTAALLPNLPTGFEAATAAANLDPKRFLQTHKIQTGERGSVELAGFAVGRWARTNATEAASWLEIHEPKLPKAAAQHVWAQVAHYGALQLNPEALSWFRRAQGADLTEQQSAWLVRAALRATANDPSQWLTVRRAITNMSENDKRDPAWRYWLARAKDASDDANDKAGARSEREALARESHFYGVLAAEELGNSITPNFVGFAPPESAVAAVATRRGVARALAMYRIADLKPEARDLRNDALREWQFAIRNLDDETLLAAAEAARRQGLPDRAINTAERTRSIHDYAQRYPLPHRDTLQVQAKTFGLNEAWVFGLIRQESRFITDARSRVGAMGLMQLMPATAKWAAKQVGVRDYAVERVVDVPINLSLGSFYLRHVLDDLGHPVLATAAYNAGPGRARRWRAASPLEGAIYAESIPFNETRDYVKKVMLNKWFYLHRINGAAPKLADLMGMVPGRDSRVTPIATAAALPNTPPSTAMVAASVADPAKAASR